LFLLGKPYGNVVKSIKIIDVKSLQRTASFCVIFKTQTATHQVLDKDCYLSRKSLLYLKSVEKEIRQKIRKKKKKKISQ
jgi:hypothetical protein